MHSFKTVDICVAVFLSVLVLQMRKLLLCGSTAVSDDVKCRLLISV